MQPCAELTQARFNRNTLCALKFNSTLRWLFVSRAQGFAAAQGSKC
jgi:putative NADH-flavin reductase